MSNLDNLDETLTAELKHTLKLVPQSQRELFVHELAKHLNSNYRSVNEIEKALGEDEPKALVVADKVIKINVIRNDLRTSIRKALRIGGE